MGNDRPQRPLIGPSDIEVAAAAEGSIIVGDANESRATGVTVNACARYLDLVDTVVVEADGATTTLQGPTRLRTGGPARHHNPGCVLRWLPSTPRSAKVPSP